MSKNVVYITGGNMRVPCFVSIFSLLHNTNCKVNLYIISEDDREVYTEGLEDLPIRNSRYNLIHIDITEIDKDIPGNETVNDFANVKLAFGEILPNDETFLYLDSDTLVNSRLQNLFNRDMSGYAVAAAPSVINRSVGSEIPIESRYFNNGVMLVNPLLLNENDVFEKVVNI